MIKISACTGGHVRKEKFGSVGANPGKELFSCNFFVMCTLVLKIYTQYWYFASIFLLGIKLVCINYKVILSFKFFFTTALFAFQSTLHISSPSTVVAPPLDFDVSVIPTAATAAATISTRPAFSGKFDNSIEFVFFFLSLLFLNF